MIPVVYFYSKSRRSHDSRFYKPSDDECKLIQKFVDAGIMPVVDSINVCPDITHLLGFFWNETMDAMEYNSNHTGEAATVLVYFNDQLSLDELEHAKEYISDIIGLSTLRRKGVVTRSMAKIVPTSKIYSHSGSNILDTLYSANGRDIVSRVEGGTRVQEVNNLIQEILAAETRSVSS